MKALRSMDLFIGGVVGARICGREVSNLDGNQAMRDSGTSEEDLGRIGDVSSGSLFVLLLRLR